MKLLFALAAGALGYCYYRGSQVPRKAGPRKEELQRWEGEGGNVPTVATPSPTVIPPTFPAGDGELRH
ncbi:MAG TPA: hypothetical protein VFK48_01535 [Usitatibacter sp.]|nr:hypothetical protein [Usitatibacter sp.]